MREEKSKEKNFNNAKIAITFVPPNTFAKNLYK